MSISKEAGPNIFDTVIDRAHKISNIYFDKNQRGCKSKKKRYNLIISTKKLA